MTYEYEEYLFTILLIYYQTTNDKRKKTITLKTIELLISNTKVSVNSVYCLNIFSILILTIVPRPSIIISCSCINHNNYSLSVTGYCCANNFLKSSDAVGTRTAQSQHTSQLTG